MTLIVDGINNKTSKLYASENGVNSQSMYIPVAQKISFSESVKLFFNNCFGWSKEYYPKWVQVEAKVDGKNETVFIQTKKLLQLAETPADKALLIACFKHKDISVHTNVVAKTINPDLIK